MDHFAQLVQDAADAMYWPWTVGLLLAMGAFFTVRTRFVQFRRLPEAIRSMGAAQQTGVGGALPPYQTFMAALASTIGVGNIAGVATAIIKGGPGALFWIWCYGAIAAAVKFSEAGLGLRYRITDGQRTLAGPMYYLRDGVGLPALAWIYALVAGLACLLTTPFTQPNSVAVVLESQLKRHELSLNSLTVAGYEISLNRLAVGLVLAVLTWLVVVGGVKSLGRVAEKLSPLKVGFYLVGGLIVIAVNIAQLPGVLRLVFSEAFSLQAGLGTAEGAAVWVALRYGLARGAYANEAGYGTAAVVYGYAQSDRPDRQGLNAVVEVFIITFITCTISALVILLTGTWKIKGIESAAAVSEAFNATLPGVGGWMAAISIFLFGYTTLMGWSIFGEQFLEYLFGPRIVAPYRWTYCLLIPLGAVADVDLVWAWGDILNGAQIFPNLIGLVALSGLAATFARRSGGQNDRKNEGPTT